MHFKLIHGFNFQLELAPIDWIDPTRKRQFLKRRKTARRCRYNRDWAIFADWWAAQAWCSDRPLVLAQIAPTIWWNRSSAKRSNTFAPNSNNTTSSNKPAATSKATQPRAQAAHRQDGQRRSSKSTRLAAKRTPSGHRQTFSSARTRSESAWRPTFHHQRVNFTSQAAAATVTRRPSINQLKKRTRSASFSKMLLPQRRHSNSNIM